MRRRAKIIPFPGAARSLAGATPPPARPVPAEPAAERGLREVYRCDQAEAVVVKGLFESQGVPTFLRSRLAHSVHPFTVGAQGEVAILVPASEALRCRRLLVRLASS